MPLWDNQRRLITQVVRSYVRFCPLVLGKRALWNRVIHPYLAWESHRFLATTTFGMKIAGDSRDILQQYIYYFGMWEPHLTHWIARRLAPGDTFIDVGANIGYFSLLASNIVGKSGTVVAIEASPTIFHDLESNLALNRVSNVRAINAAVSDHHGKVRLFRGSEFNRGQTTMLPEQGFEFECEVDAAPLGALLSPDDIHSARLIKIDVEGAEWAVVAGMAPLLKDCRADLEVIVEVSPARLAQQHKDLDAFLAMFSDAGFYGYSLENDYSPLSYLEPKLGKRPVRLETPLRCQTDIIFSRQDSALL